ncbi:Protein of unknown function [Pseudonocardia thermophila]|jgi:hypothetical protein|uniref:DUF3558 domain-containing protein n=2 Tax=Pseudonocardia thermophila TaxID=1848 RepID=A0A1M6VJL5_PSETH|nr:Protein of unknown function [Pseudonocardia thermophila]
MDEFDPCSALTQAQAGQLGVGSPRPGTSSEGTRSCIWAHYEFEPRETFYVDATDLIGIESIDTVGEPFRVGPFTAVNARGRLQNFERSCSIVLSVRPGQILQVNYGYHGARPMTHDQACRRALEAAQMVVENLTRR